MRTLLFAAAAAAVVAATPALARVHGNPHSRHSASSAYAAQPRAQLRVYATPRGYDGYDAYGAYGGDNAPGAYGRPFIGHDPDPFINDYLHFDPPGSDD